MAKKKKGKGRKGKDPHEDAEDGGNGEGGEAAHAEAENETGGDASPRSPQGPRSLQSPSAEDTASKRGVVIRNPLLGKGDMWTQERVEALGEEAVGDKGKVEGGGHSSTPGVKTVNPLAAAGSSYVLNPLAGLTGAADGASPSMVLISEEELNDQGKEDGKSTKKKRNGKGKTEQVNGQGGELDEGDLLGENELDGPPCWMFWKKVDPWENFDVTVEKLIKEEPPRPQPSMFKGDHRSEELFDIMTDETLKNMIKNEIDQLKDRAAKKFELMLDKVEVEVMLRKTLTDGEVLYDIPPLHVTKLLKTVPTANEEWERFNVLVCAPVSLDVLFLVLVWQLTV
eukprot:SAG11_NODE_2833_length_2924_cov_3.032566_1_plen_340_part_00